jgi:hypothetical protein
MKISHILSEVTLGDYSRKAKLSSAGAAMGAAFGKPEDKEKHQDTIRRREAGLKRSGDRYEKFKQQQTAKASADAEQRIRDKYTGVDIDAEIEKLQPALKSAYNDYQYGARNTWSQGKAKYDQLSAQIKELQRAKEVLGGEQESASGGSTSAGSVTQSPGKGRPDSIVV